MHTLLFVFRYILNVIPHSLGTDKSELQKVEILYVLEILDLPCRKSTVVAILRSHLHFQQCFSTILFHMHPGYATLVFRQEKGGRMGLLVVGKRAM